MTKQEKEGHKERNIELNRERDVMLRLRVVWFGLVITLAEVRSWDV